MSLALSQRLAFCSLAGGPNAGSCFGLNVPNLEVTHETTPYTSTMDVGAPASLTMAVPTVLPTEATPLDFGHKRKHGDIIDLTGDDDDDVATAIQQSAAKRRDEPGQAESQRTQTSASGSEQIEDDEETLFEDMLEELEGQQPFIDGEPSVCTTNIPS